MKWFLLLCAAAVAFAGCSGEYFYDHVFYVDNTTGDAIEVISADGEQKVEVKSGERGQFESKRFQCSKNAKSVDYFPAETSEITWLKGYQIKVGDEVFPQSVWLKKYWTFTGWRYRSDYTLTVDQAILDELLPKPEVPEEPEEPEDPGDPEEPEESEQ